MRTPPTHEEVMKLVPSEWIILEQESTEEIDPEYAEKCEYRSSGVKFAVIDENGIYTGRAWYTRQDIVGDHDSAEYNTRGWVIDPECGGGFSWEELRSLLATARTKGYL